MVTGVFGWVVQNAWMRMVVVVLGVLSGCIVSKDECKAYGKSATDEIHQAAPGAVLAVALAGCSTCGHSQVEAHWSLPANQSATGTVEIQLVPHCLVRDTTLTVDVFTGTGIADNN